MAVDCLFFGVAWVLEGELVAVVILGKCCCSWKKKLLGLNRGFFLYIREGVGAAEQ
jgi:hypothetical protein